MKSHHLKQALDPLGENIFSHYHHH